MKSYWSILALGGCLGVAAAARAADVAQCTQLAQLNLPDTRIEKAEVLSGAPPWQIPDGVFARLGGGPRMTVPVPFCRVSLVIEKEIQMEVWLPDDWNHRFEGVGNAGLTGALNYPSMVAAVRAHFATASTDTGHITDRDVFQADWIAGHPQRVIDFGHRAHHLMAARAKDVIAAYYGQHAAHSYFSGCSSGGWQGLTEAQRYAGDYDGILAGAPAINYLGATMRGMVLAQDLAAHPDGNLDAAASALLVQGALARCDAEDGLKDGLISAPFGCGFDPAQLLCKADQSQSCLTAAQVARARLVYGPHRTPGGLKLYPGPTWGTAAFFSLGGPPPAPAAVRAVDPLSAMMTAVTGTAPQWTPATFDPDKDLKPVLRALGPDLNSTDPDLNAFADHGGKLILYHGGADPGLSPYNTLDYLNAVSGKLGAAKVQTFVRTYFAPGMFHCVGGTGPSVFDAMTPLIAWVEKGEAPREIVATQPGANGTVTRTRPLCPYPQVAAYKGNGSVDEAGSFECKVAAR
jgi:feruloyl esterase